MIYLKLFENFNNDEIIKDQVVIKDEFLSDAIDYVDDKLNNQLASLGFLAKTISSIFKGRIAIKEPFDDNEQLSTLHYNINGHNVDLVFPTKKLISAADYEFYDTTNKYNL